jgi:phage tail sheath protein FI
LQPGDGNFENALLNDSRGYGLPLLTRVPIFNLLCVPGETDGATIQSLQAFCVRQRAFLIVDAPQTATHASLNASGPLATAIGGGSPPAITMAPNAGNSAYYFPWISAPDPLAANRPRLFPPSGFMAGIYAATDAATGVWKSPAGIDAGLTGVSGLQYVLTDLENGDLNTQGVNCLRQFRVYGNVVWGARTLLGADQIGSEWKYLCIRRLALFIEASLFQGTQWVVFEPNDAPLWGQIRLNVGAFMQTLFRQGAFQGSSPQQAYFVKCDSETTTPTDQNNGVVNILVGFAPLKPAEFVVIQIQQMAAQANQ